MPKRKEPTGASYNPARDRHAMPLPDPLDTTPVEMGLGRRRPMSLHEMMARFIRDEMANGSDQDPETWIEANDFDLDDEDADQLDFSPYELKEVIEEDLEPEGTSPEAASEAPDATVSEPEGSTPPPDSGERTDETG